MGVGVVAKITAFQILIPCKVAGLIYDMIYIMIYDIISYGTI